MLPRLDARCHGCMGKGFTASEAEGAAPVCRRCGGRGRQLTEDGRRLLAFLREWDGAACDEIPDAS